MSSHVPSSSTTLPPIEPSTYLSRGGVADRFGWLVILPSIALAVICAGYYQKPHSDFAEFWLTGESLMRGELPASLKRGPVFPLLISLLTRAMPQGWPWAEYPRPQAAAALVNGLLLPVNVGLCWLFVRRVLGAASGVWVAAAFAVLPIGLELTAHCLIEPLLVTLLLAVGVAYSKLPWLAWALASLAAITRYDIAGVLPGLLLAEHLRGVPIRRTFPRFAIAVTPLVGWLGLTALTWNSTSADHYLTQIRNRGAMSAVGFAATVHESIFSAGPWSVPLWLSDQADHIRVVSCVIFWLLAVVGVGRVGRRQRAISAFILCTGVLYALIHCVFPFQFVRFGYPLAPFVLLCAAGGAQQTRAELDRSPSIRAALGLAIFVLACALFFGEVERLKNTPAVRATSLAALPVAGGLLVLAAMLATPRARGFLIASPILAWFALYSVRNARATLGDGRQRADYVAALRWAAQHASADARVATTMPGLAALYREGAPRDWFVGVVTLTGTDPQSLASECREKQVRWLVWHDRELAEAGDHYIELAGLRRFEGWPKEATSNGWHVVAEFGPRPQTWILSPW